MTHSCLGAIKSDMNCHSGTLLSFLTFSAPWHRFPPSEKEEQFGTRWNTFFGTHSVREREGGEKASISWDRERNEREWKGRTVVKCEYHTMLPLKNGGHSTLSSVKRPLRTRDGWKGHCRPRRKSREQCHWREVDTDHLSWQFSLPNGKDLSACYEYVLSLHRKKRIAKI